MGRYSPIRNASRRLESNATFIETTHDTIPNNNRTVIMDSPPPVYKPFRDNDGESSPSTLPIYAKSQICARRKQCVSSLHRKSYFRKCNAIIWKLAAVFLVVVLSSETLFSYCSAEPVVPRNVRTLPTRVTYGDIEKANKTCSPKDTCAPSRHGIHISFVFCMHY